MSRLPNHSTQLSSSLSALHRPLKAPKFPGAYPGQPYLTSKVFQKGEIVPTIENNANGVITETWHTRSDDRRKIQQHNAVFLDKTDHKNIKLLNLAELNYKLAQIQDEPDKYLKDGMSFDLDYILDNFNFCGVTMEQEDQIEKKYMFKPLRTHTVASHGTAQCVDYWTNSVQGIAVPYSSLYFVIQKVKIPDRHSYQVLLDANVYEKGLQVPGTQQKYIWQVLPWKTDKDRFIKLKDYMFRNEDGFDEIGGFWFVGRTREDVPIQNPGQLRSRPPLKISSNVQSCYQGVDSTPLQIYLLPDHRPKIFH